MPVDILAEATGPNGAIITFIYPTATDYQGQPISVHWDHYSGALYPLGATTVTCWATDSGGRTASATFTITIRDTTPPVIGVPDDITSKGKKGAYVNFAVKAYDVVDGSLTPTVVPPSGSFFLIGTTIVTVTATDSHNNVGTKTFTVTVTASRQP
jgi:hypothetical protein